MIKSQEYNQLLQKFLYPAEGSSRIDTKILKEICSSEDYHRLIDFTSILNRLFSAGKQSLSLRELIRHNVFSQEKSSDKKIQLFVDALSVHELEVLVRQLQQVRKKLAHTVYSYKLYLIINILKKTLSQLKPAQERKIQDYSSILGDWEILEEQYKKVIASNVLPLQQISKNAKLTELLKNPKNWLDGRFTNAPTLLKLMGDQILPLLQRNILSIPINNHNERQSEISRTLKFISQCVIPQYQIQVQISKNTLVETRIYNNKLYRELLSRNYLFLLKKIAKIVNQAILSPSSINIQLLLLRILRRIYLLSDDSSPHSSTQLQIITENALENESPAKYVKKPLFLVMRNISLFASDHQQEIKEAAMLTYKIVQDKNDLQLASMLQNAEEFRFLRNSKFYSSKAFTYANQIEKIYQPTQLGNLYLKYHQNIPSRQIWTLTILVERPSSLLSWQIYLSNYDIKMGIYKLQKLREYTIQEYEQGIYCKQISKLQKIQNSSANPNRGHIFLKNGVYRIVFDNSYSLIRNKDLYYTILHLECTS